jgi:hypothetical protein
MEELRDGNVADGEVIFEMRWLDWGIGGLATGIVDEFNIVGPGTGATPAAVV